MKIFSTKLFFVFCQLLLGTQLFAQPLSVTINDPGFPMECDSQGGSLSAYATGGTPPYSYQWSDGSTANYNDYLSQGTYTVTVTDAAMSTATDSFTFTSLSYFHVNYAYYAPTAGNCNGALIANVFDPSITLWNYSPFNYLDSYTLMQLVCYPGQVITSTMTSFPSSCPQLNNGFTINPSVHYAGPYSISLAQDPASCSNTRFKITNQHKIDIQSLPNVSYWGTWIDNSIAIYDLQGNMITSFYDWNIQQIQYSDTTIIDVGLNLTGTYILEFAEGVFPNQANPTDTLGVILRDTFNLVANDCGLFSGQIYYDNIGDCIIDTLSDLFIPDATLNIQPINVTIFTNSDGQFNAYLPYGNYTVTQTNPFGFDQKCPIPLINFTLNSLTPLVELEIADTSQSPPNCDLNVSLGSGAARPGFDYYLQVKVSNLNLLPTSATTLTLQLDTSLTFLSANSGGVFSNYEISWNVPPLNGFEEVYFTAVMNIPISTAIGTVLTSTATIPQLPCDTLPGNNTIVYQRTVTGSYDPNEKSVSPVGVGPQKIIPPDYKLQYTIEFENVGNDTAFKVIVIDTLSANLDLNSLQVEMSSHDYFVQINSPNILRFTFENILLPDSATNNEASKGFITFSIEQLPGLSDGTIIENNAAIYFDYNLPIITNTVFNTIKNGPVAVCQDLTVSLDSTGNVIADAQQLNGGSYDFYGISGFAVSQNSFDCSQTGVNNVTFFATNINGQTDSCIAEITVTDNISPIVFCLDTILSIDSNCTVTISPQDLISSSSDNCGPLLYSLSQSTFDCTNIGLNTVTLTATDALGNTGQCQAIVTIVDVTGIHSPESQLQNATLIPNPSLGKLKVPEIAKGGSMIVSDFTGRKVYSETNIQQLEKDFSMLPDGIYIFKFVTGTGEVRLKWVKMD